MALLLLFSRLIFSPPEWMRKTILSISFLFHLHHIIRFLRQLPQAPPRPCFSFSLLVSVAFDKMDTIKYRRHFLLNKWSENNF